MQDTFEKSTQREPLSGVGFPLHCSNCDAISGEVTLEAIRNSKGKAIRYICRRGDCLTQRNRAMVRLFKGMIPRGQTLRLTDAARRMTWVTKDGKTKQSYELTSREVNRRRKAKKQQRNSRRQNRGN